MVSEDLNFYKMRFSEYKVPPFQTIAGWKEVPVEECGEELVLLDNLDTSKIVIEPEYFNKKLKGAIKEQYLREDAVKRLLRAATILQQFDPDYKILVYDAYRPLEVQQALFDEEFLRIKNAHPDWSDEQISQETQRFVSIPSDNLTRPSPHATGGAIDLSIIKNGKQLTLSPVGPDDTSDEYGMMAQTDYYEKTQNPEDFKFRDCRRILCFCMSEAGFTNYQEEWWHFDFGNQFWGKITGQPAIYGLARLN